MTRVSNHVLTDKDMLLRLKDILRSHPVREVREDFYRAIETSEVITAFMSQNAFMLVPREQITHSTSPNRIKNLQPVLFISSLNIMEVRWYAQLELFHEYVHYRQWKTGSLPESTFVLKPVTEQTVRATCEKKWHAEFEAYQEECALAKHWGVASLLDYCKRAGTAQFAEDLAIELDRADASAKLCDYRHTRP